MEQFLFKRETELINRTVPTQKLKKFKAKDRILWTAGRFDSSSEFKCQDTEVELLFFDNLYISPMVPVVLESLSLFHSHALEVHLKFRPHAGVESMMREICKKMFVLMNAWRIVRRIRKDCTKCWRLFPKTVELQMEEHALERSIIAPPFYAVQMDIAYGFNAVSRKKARKR